MTGMNDSATAVNITHGILVVLAKDVVASIRRFAVRVPFASALMTATDELSAADDRTVKFQLKRPFPHLPMAPAGPGGTVPVIMPERLAATSPHRPVKEVVGSGPFRFLSEEHISGAKAAFARFGQYRPRGGWPDSPRIEELRRAWLDAGDLAEQRRIAAELQMQVWRDVPFIPMGEYWQTTAYRKGLTGIIPGASRCSTTSIAHRSPTYGFFPHNCMTYALAVAGQFFRVTNIPSLPPHERPALVAPARSSHGIFLPTYRRRFPSSGTESSIPLLQRQPGVGAPFPAAVGVTARC